MQPSASVHEARGGVVFATTLPRPADICVDTYLRDVFGDDTFCARQTAAAVILHLQTHQKSEESAWIPFTRAGVKATCEMQGRRTDVLDSGFQHLTTRGFMKPAAADDLHFEVTPAFVRRCHEASRPPRPPMIRVA